MKTIILYLVIIIGILFPDMAATIMFQKPKAIYLLNPVTEEVIDTVTQSSEMKNIRKVLISDDSYEEMNKLASQKSFLPDIKIEYRGLYVYIDFIFKTALFQKPTGEYQYLQLTDEANLRILRSLTRIFPDDEFTKVVYEGNARRLWVDRE